ncbi:GntR family transcriptional regulator [Ramlibacter rhizophilus]|uniref:GntR family transcriptional regulator n=1 Tax=Ramlibacter rhizophilus TaxID=1781167 RepID=A0A4Z0C3L1_9BURK|nr:GntR family transcriptional regulator [Ramlibacter rhizophilus]TFZ04805.1 GntR family transcriptional regulator [Ramlibacter rhizophilus]
MPRRPPPLDRHSEVPLYRQLAAQLLARITAGELRPGDRLPSEPELMAEHGVSRVTVRQAIALLARSGKTSAHRGKGTFVAGRVVQHDLDALQGFYQSLRSQGIEPETRLVDWAVDGGALDGVPPHGLDLPVRLRRVYAMEGKPFAVVSAYLPAEAAPLGRPRAEHLTVYEILAQYLGLAVERAEVTIRCGRPPREIGALLGPPRPGMVLLMERQSFAGPRVCEFMQIHILPERYEFRLRVAGEIELARGIHHVPSSRRSTLRSET